MAPESASGPWKKRRISVDQCERAHRAGMSPRAGSDRDQTVDASFERLFRMTHVRHVVKDQPAIALNHLDKIRDGAERGDDQWHMVPNDQFQIGASSLGLPTTG
jgi:hypothetical protein